MSRNVVRVPVPVQSPRWRAFASTAVFCLWAASPGVAAEVTLRAELSKSVSEPPSTVEVSLVPLGEDAQAEGAPEPVELELPVGESRAVELAESGAWTIETRAEGFWSPPVVIGPEMPGEPVRLRLVPTGAVRFEVEPARFAEVPTSLETRFEVPEPPGSARSEIRGTAECRIESGIAHCQLPAGRLDLRLAATPWAPTYRLDVEVAEGEPSTLPPLKLVRGASVSGWVTREGGEPAPPGTIVELSAAGTGRIDAEPRLRLVDQEVEIGERGFFQFVGVRPGSYRIVARADGFAPARVDHVEARPDLESSLLDPLVLARPVDLSVHLDPPTDPWGAPWTVRLSHLSGDGDRSLSSVTETVGTDGTLVVDRLEPGTYHVTLIAENDTWWLQEEVRIDQGRDFLPLTVPLIEIEGDVARGEETVVGELWFGTRSGVRRIVFDLDENGEFAGFLPSAGTWRVEWLPAGDEEAVTLRPVEVPDESRARLRIRIPDTEVVGKVVDSRGRSVPGAKVKASGRTEDESSIGATSTTDDEGRFRLHGLEPGSYAIHATRGREKSSFSSLTLAEDLAAPELRLVLQRELTVVGRVTTGGSPVPGATVIAWPLLGGGAGASLFQAITGPTGEFSLQASGEPGGWNFLVKAPSLPVHLGVSPVDEGAPVDIDLDSHPGTLLIEEPGTLGPSLVLVHEGAFLPLSGFVRMVYRERRPTSQGDGLVLPGLEPGEYALCDARAVLAGGGPPGESCSTGVLAPYGELRLSPPPPAR